MEVFLANEQDVAVDETRLSALARHALEAEDVESGAELSVLLVTPGHIRQLNHRFAGDNHETDVLAFPMMEDDEDDLILGDVVICPRVAERSAARYEHSLEHELDVLVVHGILHLLGYDHQSAEDKAKMDGRLKELLASFSSSVRR